MQPEEYLSHDGVGLAELIRTRQVSAEEVLDAAIARAERVNPVVNAIVTPMYDQARDRLATMPSAVRSGPLAGVPFLLKDLFQDYAGVPTISGSRMLRHRVPERHSEITRRWLAAGLVVLGKTNVPELGVKAVSEAEVYGPARNPWNTGHSPGGSSGGSAAAVAAGIVPLAGASDGAGSIRIPASHCGLFGFKPSRGLVPMGPEFIDLLNGSVVNGVLSRTVRDTATALRAVIGLEPGARFAARLPTRALTAEVGVAPRRLRIGFSTRPPVGGEPDPEAVRAVQRAIAALTDLGHDVEPARPAIDDIRLTNDFITVYLGGIAALTAGLSTELDAPMSLYEVDTRLLAATGRRFGLVNFLRAQQRFDDYAVALDSFHETYDLLLTPTVARPAPRIGELATPRWQAMAASVGLRLHVDRLMAVTDLVIRQVTRHLAATPYTFLANITGRPAMSVPLHQTATGLPLGVQFIAPNSADGLLLRLAGQLEQAAPWPTTPPPGETNAAADGIRVRG